MGGGRQMRAHVAVRNSRARICISAGGGRYERHCVARRSVCLSSHPGATRVAQGVAGTLHNKGECHDTRVAGPQSHTAARESDISNTVRQGRHLPSCDTWLITG